MIDQALAICDGMHIQDVRLVDFRLGEGSHLDCLLPQHR